LKFVSQERAQRVLVAIQTGKKVIAGGFELLEGFVISAIQYVFLAKNFQNRSIKLRLGA
jgi:hypothetical protein